MQLMPLVIWRFWSEILCILKTCLRWLQLDDGVEVAHFISRWGDHAEGLEDLRITNPDAIGMALALLTLTKRDLKMRGARAILQLAKSSTLNRRALSASSCVSLIIDCFSDVFTTSKSESSALNSTLRELCAVIGIYRLSNNDARGIAELALGQPPASSMPTALTLLKDTSLGRRREGSLQFPFFEGIVNGPAQRSCTFLLELPLFNLAWPPRTGLSVVMWVQLETPEGFATTTTGPSAHLFCLSRTGKGEPADSHGYALTGVVENGVIRVTAPHARIDASFTAMPLQYGRLYHVALVYQRLLLNPDVVRLYVDGEEVGSHRAASDPNAMLQGLASTMVTQPYRIDIGGSLPAPSFHGEPKDPPDMCVQRIGNILVVDEPLPSSYILPHFIAGPLHDAQPTMDLWRVLPHVNARSISAYSHINGGDLSFGSILQPPRSGVISEDAVKLQCSASSVVEKLGGPSETSTAAGGKKERGAGEMVRNCANQQSIASVLGSDGEAPRTARMSARAHAFSGAPPSVALSSVGGVALALTLMSRAETAEQLDDSLDVLLALMEGGPREAEQAYRLGANKVVALLLRRKLEHARDSTMASVLRFSGVTVGDERAVISNPAALYDLVLARVLWRKAPPQMQAKLYQMLSASLCSSNHHAYNAMRLALIGGFQLLLRVVSDESTPEDALVHLLAIIKMHLRKHMRPADINDVLMCVMSSFPHAGEGGTSAEPEDADTSTGRITILSDSGTTCGTWGKGAAAAVRRIQVRNMLLSAVLELVGPPDMGGEESVYDTVHKSFGARQLLKMLQAPSLHPSTAVILMQLLLQHLSSKPKYAKRFKRIGGFKTLRTALVPLSDCPYMLLLTLHLIFGTPVRDLPQGLDQEVLVVCVDALAQNSVEFPEAMQVYTSMIEGLCARDGEAFSELSPWEGICRLPTHADSLSSSRLAKGDTVPHVVPENEQRALAATATDLLALLFEISPSFQASARDGAFNADLLTLALAPALCSPAPPGGRIRMAQPSLNSPASIKSPSLREEDESMAQEDMPEADEGMMEVSETEFQALQDQMEGHVAEERALSSARHSLAVIPSNDDEAPASPRPSGGRWSMPGFSKKPKTPSKGDGKEISVDSARILPLAAFKDVACIQKLRLRVNSGMQSINTVVPEYVDALDGPMATKVLELVCCKYTSVTHVRNHIGGSHLLFLLNSHYAPSRANMRHLYAMGVDI
jgi:hypothetical protein